MVTNTTANNRPPPRPGAGAGPAPQLVHKLSALSTAITDKETGTDNTVAELRAELEALTLGLNGTDSRVDTLGASFKKVRAGPGPGLGR